MAIANLASLPKTKFNKALTTAFLRRKPISSSLHATFELTPCLGGFTEAQTEVGKVPSTGTSAPLQLSSQNWNFYLKFRSYSPGTFSSKFQLLRTLY